MNTEEKKLQTQADLNSNKNATKATEKDLEALNNLEEDIIRNDTIPATKDTPGSNGAYPVGAFDTSKD